MLYKSMQEDEVIEDERQVRRDEGPGEAPNAAAWSVNIRVMGDPLWQSLGWGDRVEGNI